MMIIESESEFSGRAANIFVDSCFSTRGKALILLDLEYGYLLPIE